MLYSRMRFARHGCFRVEALSSSRAIWQRRFSKLRTTPCSDCIVIFELQMIEIGLKYIEQRVMVHPMHSNDSVTMGMSPLIRCVGPCYVLAGRGRAGLRFAGTSRIRLMAGRVMSL